MTALGHDIRRAGRTLIKNPLFSSTVVVVLGLGIAACVVVFTAVNAVLLQPLPFQDPDRLAFIWSSDSLRPETRLLSSWPDYVDWRTRTRAFDDLAALRFGSGSLGRQGEPPVRVATVSATPNSTSLLGISPGAGRLLTPDDGIPGSPAVAVLSHGLWVRAFGGDPAVLGKTLRLNSIEHTVVGILSPELDQSGPLRADVWTSLALDSEVSVDRSDRSYLVIGRLRPGVSFPQAAAELDRVARELGTEHPETNAGWGVRTVPARDLGASARTVLGILGLVVALLLFIACANVAGLLLARSASRRRETAVRRALGASRSRLLWQFLTEDLLLALLATGLGLLLAHGGLRLVGVTTRGADPLLSRLAIDPPVLLFAAAVALVTPVLFGLIPALAALRGDSIHDLKSAGARGIVSARARGRRFLVVSQFAMTMALLAVTSLLVQTVVAIADIELGFVPEETLMLRVDLSGPRYESSQDAGLFMEEALGRIRALPGVTAAAATTRVPIADRETTRPFFIAGQPSRPDEPLQAGRVLVSPGFLQATGVPLLEGRGLRDDDGPSATRVGLVNQALAQRYWPGRSPLGERLQLAIPATPAQMIEVIGVIGNVRSSDADQPPVPQIYLSLRQQPEREFALLVRDGTDAERLIGPIRSAVADIEPDLALYDVRTMEQVVFDDLATPRLMAGLFAAFGLVALALALAGLYGMLAWSVGQRTAEIGLRMALGAGPGGILRRFLREAGALAGLGIAIGLVAGLVLEQLVQSELYGVTSTDLLTYLVVPALLALVALTASLGPAHRATRVDPMTALRSE